MFVEYVLIAQDRPHIEYFIRQHENRWLFSETNRVEDTLDLDSIGCALSVEAVYDKVPL